VKITVEKEAKIIFNNARAKLLLIKSASPHYKMQVYHLWLRDLVDLKSRNGTARTVQKIILVPK
jgi:hypothetical protein